ncbi:MAG: heme-binding domain-containing protein [Myxococcales bacterium]|nr:heme-binding domain-containing protein [Myxococcales bacterium]
MSFLIRGVGFLMLLLVLIQLVPYGRDHSNPQATGEVVWDSEETKALFTKACADCHSHETRWPWYANVAPVSWLVTHDVNEGREHFNVSAWGQQEHNEADEAAEEVEHGHMPPMLYPILHPEAELSEEERSKLIAGLKATFNSESD